MSDGGLGKGSHQKHSGLLASLARSCFVQDVGYLCPNNALVPTDLIVLAVGVVVAFLCAANLVAGHEHRHAARHHENDGKVLDLPFPQRFDGWIVGWAFAAAVPAQSFR